MTIHTTHPFAEADPDPARRFRARASGAVTLWTTGDEAERAGLTVTSLMVALGPEASVLALLDPDSDLLDVLRETRRAVVQVLSWPDRQLAEAFAGTAPAPGGPFRQAEFVDTTHGPRLASASTWAQVRLEDEREIGWSVEVRTVVEHVGIGDLEDPLLHHGGRFHRAG
ncbi:flavin reductase [Nocardioides sp. Root190]|uniref:flavin reductase family protein n=1 Tax=Nocardioides sp. Root190 TaxID=1736488 RepID=UPI0006F3D9AD|nr:flavin reductase [Nocardioides sp. Root190]KRB75992.1 flavin reductase [Nocardioides sp. Root190]